MQKMIITVIAIFFAFGAIGQVKEIKIEETRKANRLFLYAVNENLVDMDVTLSVEGTGFRQSTRKPRAVRVPATSKVNMLGLVINRGEEPKYTPIITATDSLSRRAIRKPVIPVKIDPKSPINLYISENCVTCDTLVKSLENSPYRYKSTVLNENKTIKDQLAVVIPKLDTVSNAIVTIEGRLVTDIETLEELLERIK